jgi:hypothetical protein
MPKQARHWSEQSVSPSVHMIHLRNYFKDLIILVLEVRSTRVLNFHIVQLLFMHPVVYLFDNNVLK